MGILYELLAKLPLVEESENNVESWLETPKRPKTKKKNRAKSPAWQFKIPGFENDDLNENFENDNVEKTGQNLDIEDSNEKGESMIKGILNEMIAKLPLLESSMSPSELPKLTLQKSPTWEFKISNSDDNLVNIEDNLEIGAL